MFIQRESKSSNKLKQREKNGHIKSIPILYLDQNKA